MQGHQRQGTLLILGLLALAGCSESSARHSPLPRTPASLADYHDPRQTGTIRGVVCWAGELPQVPAIVSVERPTQQYAIGPSRAWPNPNAPRIGAKRGVAGAVVFLRQVELARSRPWDHPAVTVEMHRLGLLIDQGGRQSNVGFVRRLGPPVTMISRDDNLYILRARGEAFFSLTFPDPQSPRQRTFDQPGVVELSSGAGHIWMRGYLFVWDHPYLTHTSAEGTFALERVPAGTYELNLWMPNWHIARTEPDANTTEPCRLSYHPPLTRSQVVVVKPGEAVETAFAVQASDFQASQERK